MKNLKTPKLSKRLLAIAGLTGDCERFYDLCCDHGKLGEYILQNSQSVNVIFVDPIESIINNLKNRISQIAEESVQFEIKRAQDIQYLENSVISIAGVGTHMAIEILEVCKDVDGCSFILNTNGDPLALRKYLIENNFKLDSEILISENNQFYEILKVGKMYLGKVSAVGDSVLSNFNGSREYLEERINELKLKTTFNDDKYLKLCLYEYLTKLV